MATIAATIAGFCNYNSGWNHFGDFRAPGSTFPGYAGPIDSTPKWSICKITLPAVQGSTSNKNLSFTLNVTKTSNGPTYATMRYGISTTLSQENPETLKNNGTLLGVKDTYISGITSTSQQFSFVTNNFTLPNNTTTIYLYIWTTGCLVQLYKHSSYYTAALNYIAITNVGAPTSVSCNVGTSIIIPSQKITISWSGATNGVSNNISKYYVYWKQGSTPTASSYGGRKEAKASDKSLSFTLDGISRGNRIYFAVQTIGSASGYNSGLKSITGPLINILPTAPTVEVVESTLPSSGGNYEFKITLGTDSQSQTVKTYYIYDNLENPVEVTKTSLVINNTTLGINQGEQKNITFYSDDGLEESKKIQKTLKVNLKPEITKIIHTPTYLKSQVIQENETLSKKSSLSLNVNKDDIKTYEWFLKESDALEELDNSTEEFLGNESSYTNLLISQVNRGNFYKIGAKITDNFGEVSEIVWSDKILRYPYKPKSYKINNVINNYIDTPINDTDLEFNFFETGLTLNGVVPEREAGYCELSYANFIYQEKTSNNILSLSQEFSIQDNELDKISIQLNSVINRNDSIIPGVRLFDVAGDYTDILFDQFFTRVYLPFLNGNEKLNYNLNDFILKPFTNNINYVFSGTKGQSCSNNYYSLTATIPEKNLTIELLNKNNTVDFTSQINGFNTLESPIEINEVDGDGARVEIYLNYNTLNAFFGREELGIFSEEKNEIIWNNNFSNVIFTLSLYDVFGNKASNTYITNPFSINFIEKPIFREEDFCNIYINPYREGELIITPAADNSSLQNTTVFNNTRIYHSGENLIFYFPAATDYNKDIKKYNIYISRNYDAKPNNFEELSYSLLTSFNKTNDNEERFSYQVNNNTNINYFSVFKITAIDEKENESEPIYSSTYLVRCKKNSPVFNFNKISVNELFQIEGSLTVNDLGGSLFNSNEFGYYKENLENSFPNFERTIENYNKNVLLLVEYCLDGKFENNIETKEIILKDSNDNFIELLEETNFKTEVISEDYQNKKLYIRITLKISTGPINSIENEYVEQLSNVLIFFSKLPTVSYRHGALGVNFNRLLEENYKKDVMTVSDTTGRYLIRFIGTPETGEEHTLIIDLKTGQIIGAYLDCGNWDIEGAITSEIIPLIDYDEQAFYVQVEK